MRRSRRVRAPRHENHHCRLGRRVRFRRPLQYLLPHRDVGARPAARLRCLLAPGPQGPRRRSQCDRRRPAQPSAWRSFRRCSLPGDGRPFPQPAFASAAHRRAAGNARASRCRARNLLSAIDHDRVAISMAGRRDRPGHAGRIFGALGHTVEVVHQSGAPSTAVRISDHSRVLAYSGDTEWTDALISVATGADLFIVECYEHSRAIAGHMNWTKLSEKLSALGARKIMVTHMNPSMLAKTEEVRATGVLIASDGMVLD